VLIVMADRDRRNNPPAPITQTETVTPPPANGGPTP